ncbi:GNAT family N-acetyltransferase [Malonomonas rubra]|uniref:GNAT family N-acetyltransferase n=1 Tax=Malonomonas rubra TaxID=57040 RepID=UPI0026F18F76|nr:GNAT family N-acetyltransferase [Malonomonas rubra]
MFEFRRLTAENFCHYEYLVMASEEVFPEDIRETPETYLEALRQDGVQAFLAYFAGDYAGNVVGFSPCPVQQRILRLHELDTSLDGLIYLFNIVAMPQFQGCGVGRHLLKYFLSESREAGFIRVGGHFRGNGSLKNFTNRGGAVLAVFDDWFGTGESYSYCELDL